MPAAVPVLIGAAEALVTQRELRGQYVTKGGTGYHTNQAIKTWACWFQLKALTTSGKIKAWTQQVTRLLSFVQMNENTFRRRLQEMQQLELISITEEYDILLASYQDAALILDIPYQGTIQIDYNPEKNNGKQIFQYFLRAEEIKVRQQKQREALTYHLNKNPLLKNNLHVLMVQQGSDSHRLDRDPEYYRQQLLKLQMQLFKKGSDILDYVMQRRADCNRSTSLIKEDHHYRGPASVTYLKRKLQQLDLVKIDRVSVESDCRSRLYIFSPLSDKKRDGYKWNDKKKQTFWRLCDQVAVKTVSSTTNNNEKKKVA